MERKKIGFYKSNIPLEGEAYYLLFPGYLLPPFEHGFDRFVHCVLGFMHGTQMYDVVFVTDNPTFQEFTNFEKDSMLELIRRHNQSALAKLVLDGKCPEITDPRAQNMQLGLGQKVGEMWSKNKFHIA